MNRTVAIPESMVMEWGKRLAENRARLLQEIDALRQQVIRIELELKQLDDYCGAADQNNTNSTC